MKAKVAELTGPALDWVVAKCEGLEVYVPAFAEKPWLQYRDCLGWPRMCPKYSTDWAHSGPIIEREWLHVEPWPNSSDEERRWSCSQYELTTPVACLGPTPLIAAMRCFVTSKLGDEVDIPDEFLRKR